MNCPNLPVAEILPELLDRLDNGHNAVLVAPPGAGKTTLVPLALLDAPWRGDGKIIVLEPRRLAARTAASRMAYLLGEKVGERVGYRVRMDTKVSSKTRIEVVTEGVFTRMILQNGDLSGIAVVLFDEFHERSLDCDLGLALALDVQEALRDDLRLIAMSATIDGAAVARLMQCDVIESEGRAFPVGIRYLEMPAAGRLEDFVVRTIEQCVAEEDGSILVFLPGQGEIERVADKLEGRFPAHVEIHRLYGALDGGVQDRAIRPADNGKRKIVLATSIAETSLTIDGVTIVIDSGLARVPRFDPASGLTRLETVRASKASIDQRAGRAGRTAPGIAIRLWREQQTMALPAHSTPEILAADLSHLALDLASWGVGDVTQLKWLNPPPAPALAEARSLLEKLGALDGTRLTPHGNDLRNLALPPRSGHMLLMAAKHGCAQMAARLSVLMSERGLGGNDVDLERRFERMMREKGGRARAALALAKRLANRIDAPTGKLDPLSIGALLSLAWPERIAQRTGQSRSGAIRYRLANGSGAELEADHALASSPWLVIADITGRAGAARILSAAAITLKEIEVLHADAIVENGQVTFDPQTGKVKAQKLRQLGSLKLAAETLANPDPGLVEKALINAVRHGGLDILNWDTADNALRKRLAFLHGQDATIWPDVGDNALIERLDEWLSPFVAGKSALSEITTADLDNGLKLLVPWEMQASIDTLAPSRYKVPEGSAVMLRYEEEKVVLSARVQVFYGCDEHPSINNAPLTLELLSPAQRPVQITRDLPGFWRGSWADVRVDMRARYPKHHWPEDPVRAEPVLHTKRRKERK